MPRMLAWQRSSLALEALPFQHVHPTLLLPSWTLTKGTAPNSSCANPVVPWTWPRIPLMVSAWGTSFPLSLADHSSHPLSDVGFSMEHSKEKLIHLFVPKEESLSRHDSLPIPHSLCSEDSPGLQSLPGIPRDVVFSLFLPSCSANNNPHSLPPGSCSKVPPSSPATLFPITVWPWAQNSLFLWASLPPGIPYPHPNVSSLFLP